MSQVRSSPFAQRLPGIEQAAEDQRQRRPRPRGKEGGWQKTNTLTACFNGSPTVKRADCGWSPGLADSPARRSFTKLGDSYPLPQTSPMVSHDPSSPSSGRAGDQGGISSCLIALLAHDLYTAAVHPASQTGSAIDSVDWDADGSDESAYASAASSPTSPPSSPVIADMVTGSEERPSRYRSHTVVNITVNATTAPVTVQTGDRARTGPPTTPSAHMSELHRRPGTAQPARTPNQVRSRPPPTSSPASLTGRTPVRARSRQDHASAARAVPVTSSRPRPALPQETLSRVESAPRPMTPVSPITRSRPRPLPISSEAQARRLREIEQALEQVRVEQEEGVMADAPQDATPSLVDPAGKSQIFLSDAMLFRSLHFQTSTSSHRSQAATGGTSPSLARRSVSGNTIRIWVSTRLEYQVLCIRGRTRALRQSTSTIPRRPKDG